MTSEEAARQKQERKARKRARDDARTRVGRVLPDADAVFAVLGLKRGDLDALAERIGWDREGTSE